MVRAARGRCWAQGCSLQEFGSGWGASLSSSSKGEFLGECEEHRNSCRLSEKSQTREKDYRYKEKVSEGIDVN